MAGDLSSIRLSDVALVASPATHSQLLLRGQAGTSVVDLLFVGVKRMRLHWHYSTFTVERDGKTFRILPGDDFVVALGLHWARVRDPGVPSPMLSYGDGFDLANVEGEVFHV